MAKVEVHLREGVPYCVDFRCPGCGNKHQLPVRPHTNGSGAGWAYSGTPDNPTLEPSILSKVGPFPKEDFPEEYIIHGKKSQLNAERLLICHSFVRAGRIEFLPDSTHDLSGQTVELPQYTPEE